MNSLILFLGFLNLASAAEPSPRISVTRFNQEVEHLIDGCNRWDYSSQDQLRTEMESALSRQGLRVLERKSIRAILADEHDLPNLDKRSAPKRGKLLAAQYTITGGVTELGICEERSKSGVQLGGLLGLIGGPSGVDLKVGGHKGVSKIKLTAQVVSTETGEVLKSFDARAEIAETGIGGEVGYAGVGVDHKSRSTPPIERASNEAIADLAHQIANYVRNL